MVAADSPRVLDVLANASAVIAEGEVLQLRSAKNLTVGEQDYLNVISAKTAALFAAAAERRHDRRRRTSPDTGVQALRI